MRLTEGIIKFFLHIDRLFKINKIIKNTDACWVLKNGI